MSTLATSRIEKAAFELILTAFQDRCEHRVRRIIPTGTVLIDRHYRQAVKPTDEFLGRIVEGYDSDLNLTYVTSVTQAAAKGARRHHRFECFGDALSHMTRWYDRRFGLVEDQS